MIAKEPIAAPSMSRGVRAATGTVRWRPDPDGLGPGLRLGLSLVLTGLCLFAGCAKPNNSSTAALVRDKLSLGDRLIQVRDYEHAAKLFSDAVKLAPDNPEARYYKGIAHFYLGETAEAEQELKASLRLDKRNPDAHNALGLVYNKMGERERALEEYRLALGDPTQQAPEAIYLNMAACYDELGRTEEAISSLRSAVEAKPTYYAAHWELAKLLDRQNQTRAAIEEYEVAAPGYSSDPGYHYRIGLAYFREHRMERAREHLSKVVAAVPGSEKAIKAKEYLELIAAGAPH